AASERPADPEKKLNEIKQDEGLGTAMWGSWCKQFFVADREYAGPQEEPEVKQKFELLDLSKVALKTDFSDIADKGYLRDSLKWIESARLNAYGRFGSLWRSYRRNPANPASRYVARYGRTWIYDNALAIYAELKTAALAQMSGCPNTGAAHTQNAKKAADALVNLSRLEEQNGFKGLWRFSYNTIDDNFVDPRGPLGANLWALNAIYAYILQTGDERNLGWLKDSVKSFLFKQQVMDENDPRFGLIRGGLYNASDYKKGENMGYSVDEGDPNIQNEYCFIEHNADFIGTLRLAAIAEKRFNGGRDEKFLSDLRQRHELCVKAILKNFWLGDHFCTAMEPDGTINTSVAVDNNSWVADIIMPYDAERAWQSIRYNRKKFMVMMRLGDKVIDGLSFFAGDFKDPYLMNMSDADRKLMEEMVQPEATFGYVLLLMRYAEHTPNKERKAECLMLINRLYRSMVLLKEHFGGLGTPYATVDIPGYFNTMESMAGTATGVVVTTAMLGVDADDFIGISPPEDFTVDGRRPFSD
ncbi:MAG: hypothetical protein ABH825_02110, partial [Candidatus Omnitrophota bacterium]